MRNRVPALAALRIRSAYRSSVSSISEARQVRERGRPGSHMHPAILGASMQRRDVLAGVQQSVLVERMLEREEHADFPRAELDAHLVDLLDAHAVFARDGAAD